MGDRVGLILAALAVLAAIPAWLWLIQRWDSRPERPRAPAKVARSATSTPKPEPAPVVRSSRIPKIGSAASDTPPAERGRAIMFAFGSAELDDESHARIAAAAARYRELPILSLTLDASFERLEVADLKEGRALARARGREVHHALENAGLSVSIFTRVSQDAIDAPNEAGRAALRRVLIEPPHHVVR
jgi:hypothetical protein